MAKIPNIFRSKVGSEDTFLLWKAWAMWRSSSIILRAMRSHWIFLRTERYELFKRRSNWVKLWELGKRSHVDSQISVKRAALRSVKDTLPFWAILLEFPPPAAAPPFGGRLRQPGLTPLSSVAVSPGIGSTISWISYIFSWFIPPSLGKTSSSDPRAQSLRVLVFFSEWDVLCSVSPLNGSSIQICFLEMRWTHSPADGHPSC